jgi:hypothetical protein
MVGMMVDDVDQRKIVKGHAAKRRWHEVKFKTFEDPIVLANVGWQILFPPWLYTLCSQYL